MKVQEVADPKRSSPNQSSLNLISKPKQFKIAHCSLLGLSFNVDLHIHFCKAATPGTLQTLHNL